MLNDELIRATRGVANLKLYLTDFIKCSKKDGRDVEAAVYNEMLYVLDNIGKTIDDALLLQKIRGMPEEKSTKNIRILKKKALFFTVYG